MQDVPKVLEAQMNDGNDRQEIGGANAEANGVWRILRNSILLTVAGIAFAVIVVWAI